MTIKTVNPAPARAPGITSNLPSAEQPNRKTEQNVPKPPENRQSRRAQRTRTRRTGTSSTTDGLLCGEIASAAGRTRARCGTKSGARPSILGPFAVLHPAQCRRARRESRFFCPFLWFLPKIAKKPQKPVAKSGANFQQKIANWRKTASFAKKNLDRVARSAPAAERNPAHRSPDRAGAPAYRVRSAVLDHRIRARDPPGPHAPSRLQGPCF